MTKSDILEAIRNHIGQFGEGNQMDTLRDERLAEFFNVTTATIDNWMKKHPKFFGTIKRGKIRVFGHHKKGRLTGFL